MDIFNALTDLKRRILVEALFRHEPQSIKQLSCNRSVSRQAITKQLNMLIKAKIVRCEFVGKERVHYLNPKAVQKLDDWLAPFAAQWDKRFADMLNYLGENNEQ
jgi:predicted transcriptional regulator